MKPKAVLLFLFEKISAVEKTLARQIKTQINNIKNDSVDITTDAADIKKKITREYSEEIYAH